MKSLVVLVFAACLFGVIQTYVLDSEYLSFRGFELDEEPTKKFRDPNCGSICTDERYSPVCGYQLGTGYETFDNPCDYLNALKCVDPKICLIKSGRCPKKDN